MGSTTLISIVFNNGEQLGVLFCRVVNAMQKVVGFIWVPLFPPTWKVDGVGLGIALNCHTLNHEPLTWMY